MKPTCKVEGCERVSRTRGLCNAHYIRFRRHGNPLSGRVSSGEPMKFLMSALELDTDDCVVWPYGKDGKGYAYVYNGKRFEGAYRIVCKKAHGEPPSTEHQAAHSCGNRVCINPKHLRWATQSENEADKILHGTAQRGERAGSVKLKEYQVHDIRALRGKMIHKDIAEIYGVSTGAIGHILRGTTWGWLK